MGGYNNPKLISSSHLRREREGDESSNRSLDVRRREREVASRSDLDL